MSEYAVKPLDATTWDAYAGLLDKHNGLWVRWLLVHVVPHARRQA